MRLDCQIVGGRKRRRGRCLSLRGREVISVRHDVGIDTKFPGMFERFMSELRQSLSGITLSCKKRMDQCLRKGQLFGITYSQSRSIDQPIDGTTVVDLERSRRPSQEAFGDRYNLLRTRLSTGVSES